MSPQPLTITNGLLVTPETSPERGSLRLVDGRIAALGAVSPESGDRVVDARGALITSMPDMNIVSREHWIGYDLNDKMLVRAGRIPLPYGLRVEEHTLLARQATQVNINDGQQLGAPIFDIVRIDVPAAEGIVRIERAALAAAALGVHQHAVDQQGVALPLVPEAGVGI